MFRCSRELVRLVSDCEGYTVNVTQVGINSSTVGGKFVGLGKMVVAWHKTQVEWFDSSEGIVLVGEKGGVKWIEVGNRKMLVRKRSCFREKRYIIEFLYWIFYFRKHLKCLQCSG